MTISSEITKLNTNLQNSYSALEALIAPAVIGIPKNFDNLATCISNIPTGGETSRYGVTLDNFFGSVDANGKMSAPSITTNLSFDGVKDLGQYALRRTFSNNPTIATAVFPDLTTISENYALNNSFNGCHNLTSLSFPKLTTTSAQYEFYGMCANPSARTIDLSSLTNANPRSFYQACNSNTNLTSIDFSSLTTAKGPLAFYQAFQNCTALSSISFPELVQIGSETATGTNGQTFALAFSGTDITELRFPKLEKIYINGGTAGNNGTFANNETIQKMYFPKLDTIDHSPAYTGTSSSVISARKLIFYNCTSLTEIHFAAANETAIKATAGWSTLWGRGAGNATVYFDL